MVHLRLTLLGSFQALLDDRPVTTFESAKARALLTYLAAESDRTHRREALAELFWPERPPGAALANLRHTLANLRTTIGDQTATPPVLLITPQTIQFNRDSDTFVDLIRFATLLYAGAKSSLPACQEAMALHNGRLLENFSLDDSPEFEAWLAVMRERIDRQAGQALARLVRHCVEQGDTVRAVQWTQRQLDLEPWNEDAHRQLMWLLAQSGQRAAALHQYDLCTQMLAAELDVAPQPNTRTLAERIRTGESELGAVSGLDGRPLAAAAVAMRLAGVHHLPTQVTPFVGRVHELSRILDALTSARCRLLTIVGPGGIGKTRLAVEVSKMLASRFADGIWFIDLAPATVAVLPAVLLQRLNAPETGSADARQRLITHLIDKEMLLVLDNFEHLLEDAALATELLAAAPAVKILATSRASLRLQEEWLEPLTGMETPPSPDAVQSDLYCERPDMLESAPDLDAYDATRLFLQCVRRLRPDFAPDAADARQIAQLCRQLEGMPLGIELTAAWMRSLPLSSLVDEVASGLSHLETPLRNMLSRHRSMSAAFEHSWRLASDREQSVLRQLSVFRGGFTRAAAAAVAGASLGDLEALIDKSWVQLQPSGRYVFHELTRQFCAEKLAGEHHVAASETVDQVRQRHCAYYSAFLHEQMQRMNYHQDVIDNVMQEFGNLQAAWDWTLEQGAVQFALDMVVNLLFLAEMAGWYHFVARVYETAAAQLAPLVASDQPDADRRQAAAVVLGWIEYCRGNLFNHLGLIERARASVTANARFLKSLAPGDAREELLSLNEWLDGMVLYFEGKFHQARRIFRKRIAGFQKSDIDFSVYGHKVGVTFWQAHALGSLGLIAYQMGDYPAAKRRLRAAITLREQTGEVRFRAHNHSLLARVLVVTGDYQTAEEHARNGLRLSQSCGDQIGIAAAHLVLSRVEAATGRLTLSQEHCRLSLATGRQSGNLHLLMDSLIHLGRIELALGRLSDATACFEEAIAAFVALDTAHSNRVGAALLGLGWAALATGDHARAEHFFRETLAARGCAAWEILDADAGLMLVLAATRQTEAAGAAAGADDGDGDWFRHAI